MALASVAATLSIRARPSTTISRADFAMGTPTNLHCRPTLRLPGAVDLPAAPDLRRRDRAVSFRECSDAAAGGQKLALVNRNLGTTLMSVCIVAAQIVMVPVAMLVGRKADVWGRKPIFATALAVLALRGALYPVSDNPYWLVSVQLLDRRRRRHFRRAVSACGRRPHP